MTDCLLCRPADADRELRRVEVWQDDLWRVTVSLAAPVVGFGYLEPKRHIPHITDLSGDEAMSLGVQLARVTSALKEASGADLLYVTVFGERHAHLHFNLAPHRAGDALTGGPGMSRPDAQEIPEGELRSVASSVGALLAR
jgi:diadenosine tetraphosphate (Ap4A) HIT family hydrolase